MEYGTPRQLPKADWIIFDAVLNERGIPRQVMIYPERYRDQYNTARRARAIKEMSKRGISRDSLTSLTPYSRRHIDRILANGSGTSVDGPSLDFQDNLLSLPPSAETEALEPNTRQGQME